MQDKLNLSDFQLEALRIIKNDLMFIKNEWNENIDDDSLRRYSSTLRLLLVDEGGLLLKAETWINLKIYINAAPNPLDSVQKEKVNFYTAGGGNYQGFKVESMIMTTFENSPDEIIKPRIKRPSPKIMKYSLSEFLNTACVIADGEVFSRIELIKFVSNKLGGAHYELDPKNMKRKRHLLNVSNTTIVANKNAIFFELLSIGQLLVKSKYTDKFIKKINSILEK